MLREIRPAIVLVAAFVIALKDRTLKRQADGKVGRRRLEEVTRQSLNAVVDTARELTTFRRRDRYNWARVTLWVAAVTLLLWGFGPLSLFWVEAAVFVFFMVFWTVQTFELETKPASVQRGSPPSKRDLVWGFGAAVALGGPYSLLAGGTPNGLLTTRTGSPPCPCSFASSLWSGKTRVEPKASNPAMCRRLSDLHQISAKASLPV